MRTVPGPLFRILLLLGLLLGCDSRDASQVVDLGHRAALPPGPPARDRPPEELRMGFDLRASPTEDARQYLPLIAYLEQATGLRIGLEILPAGDNAGYALAEGRLDVAFVGGFSYVQARQRARIHPLAHGRDARGEPTYRAVIVVRPDSSLWHLGQLRGRRFAFGAWNSTQGHLIPRVMLYEAGIGLDELASADFYGSHRRCADAVIGHRADACGMQETMARDLAGAGLLRVLAVSDRWPSSGVFASDRVPAAARERLREALLAFDPAGPLPVPLHDWERTEMAGGFAPADAADWDRVESWMRRFGLLGGHPDVSGGGSGRGGSP